VALGERLDDLLSLGHHFLKKKSSELRRIKKREARREVPKDSPNENGDILIKKSFKWGKIKRKGGK
jgi:hypothetical protein